ADDFCAERRDETMQLIDIGTLARAKAEMMQSDALLLKRLAGKFRRRPADAERGTAADAIIEIVAVDHGHKPKERQQFAIELPRALEVRGCQDHMRHPVDFHRLPLLVRFL